MEHRWSDRFPSLIRGQANTSPASPPGPSRARAQRPLLQPRQHYLRGATSGGQVGTWGRSQARADVASCPRGARRQRGSAGACPEGTQERESAGSPKASGALVAVPPFEPLAPGPGRRPRWLPSLPDTDQAPVLNPPFGTPGGASLQPWEPLADAASASALKATRDHPLH